MSEIKKIFELMSKMSPDFKLNEDSFAQFNADFQSSSQPEDSKIADVKNYSKGIQNAKALSNKSNKINNRTEFLDAFKVWFNSLGYTPEKGNITTATIITDIRKAMSELGYK